MEPKTYFAAHRTCRLPKSCIAELLLQVRPAVDIEIRNEINFPYLPHFQLEKFVQAARPPVVK